MFNDYLGKCLVLVQTAKVLDNKKTIWSNCIKVLNLRGHHIST